MVRRDAEGKTAAPQAGIAGAVGRMLDEIQKSMFERARKFRDENTFTVSDRDEFAKILTGKGGFVRAPWCGAAACEAKIKEETKGTIRVIPADASSHPGKCVACGAPATISPLFAVAY